MEENGINIDAQTEITSDISSEERNSLEDCHSHTIGGDSGKSTGEITKVGYRMPPIEHRFKKGQVANPGGHPKTKHVREALMKIMEMPQEKLTTYEPKNGFEELAIAARKIALNPKVETSGALAAAAIAALEKIADRVDGKAKPSDEELNTKNQTQVVMIGGGLIGKPE
jgi:hypothetical protein